MAYSTSTSRITLNQSAYHLPTSYLSPIESSSPNTSRWSSTTAHVSKPKPLITKKSIRNLGLHPPYSIGDIAYLRYDSSSRFDPYVFKGTHISSLSTDQDTYYTAVFQSTGNLGHTAYAIDLMEDCQRNDPHPWWRRLPRFFVWLMTRLSTCVN